MIRLTEIALRNKGIVLLVSLALFFAGLVSWGSLQQELLPDIELPFITVIAAQPGAGAEDVAQQVTVPIEQAIKSVPRLEALSSTSANSLSLVIAQFEYGTNIKEAQAAIETAMEDEPKGSKWKLRARVGDKVRWYEDPEEVERHGY